MATPHDQQRRNESTNPMQTMTPGERTLRARLAAHVMHSRNDSREITRRATEAFLARFETEVDPDGTLPETERKRRAESARKAYFTRLALRSARVRRERKAKG